MTHNIDEFNFDLIVSLRILRSAIGVIEIEIYFIEISFSEIPSRNTLKNKFNE